MNSASLLEEVQLDIHIENLIPTIPPGKKKLLLKILMRISNLLYSNLQNEYSIVLPKPY